jgi:hypothetical protein
MKNGQIFAHKSTARGGLDLEYLDETSRRKVSLRERADMEQQIGRKLKHFTDYASKETLGQVHAGGFLHHSVRMNPDGTSTAPSQCSNAERKQRITEAWRKHLAKFPSSAKRPVIAHRLVFSMSKEQHDALTGAGVNPDQVLHSTLKKVMRRFNEGFHPNDSIGYAYGIHHDTPICTCTSPFVRIPKTGATSAAARPDPTSPNTRSRWTASNRGSRSRTPAGRKF